ncbi:MAG: toll/interleukin-1 receptor domain-containing protein [Desulfobacteraceae bacterium]|nr:toll/interleukin-1 receptor domain-containing protein [Desulfobacteraceae bacterium]
MESNIKIFISYANEDYEIAKRLYDDLKASGIMPWLDKENILPGQNWKDEINKAIKNSSHFLMLLSSNSVSKRGYVQKEKMIALELLDEIPIGNIYVIPVRLDGSKPVDEKLQNLQWVDLFPSYNTGLKQIIRALKPDEEVNDDIEFVNRHNEIQFITNIYCPLPVN